MVKVNIEKLLLLVFENNWCAQCYTERPVVQRIVQKFNHQVGAQFINVEQNLAPTRKYGIHSAPTIVVVKDGIVVEQIPRFVDQGQLETIVRYYL